MEKRGLYYLQSLLMDTQKILLSGVPLENPQVAEIEDVQVALEKLANGEYGVCTACGEEIGFVWLEEVPTRSLCEACDT